MQQLRIFTASGVLVRNYTLTGKGMANLDIRSLPKGMYVLQAEGSEGRSQKQWIRQ
ncbi:MAG: T9SS type A sorting domain-containing protein [Chitinophagaceae bacterium]